MLLYLNIVCLIFLPIKSNNIIILDRLFKSYYDSRALEIEYCRQYKTNSFYYKGRPDNIKDILDSKRGKDLSNYKYVYISDIKYLEDVTAFPKSTIFFVLDSMRKSSSSYNKDYCYFEIKWDLKKYNAPYYLIAGEEFTKNNEELIIGILLVFFLMSNIFLITVNLKSCCLNPLNRIFHYSFALTAISLTNISTISCALINYFLLTYLLYSFYKAYIIMNLIFLVNGFMILHYDYSGRCIFFKHLIFFFIFDSCFSIFFLYIIFFIPSLNNYYFFALKNWIMHLVVLLYAIKCMKEKFMPLYRQYKFEKERKTFFTIAYKLKLIIYSKILLFTFIYCLVFIILPFIEIAYSFNKYAEAFLFNYYINASCEMFLCFILSIMFFPFKISFLFYLPIYYDYNSRKFVAKISKEDEKVNNISNLTKKVLKSEKKENIPIVLMNPYSDNNNYNKLYIGKTENIQ